MIHYYSIMKFIFAVCTRGDHGSKPPLCTKSFPQLLTLIDANLTFQIIQINLNMAITSTSPTVLGQLKGGWDEEMK